ncbi:MAG: hypothetical protein K2W94_00135 [Alphaproteobacteria bacterium]|nr:hypothetical protein [Alphaproteobacteria bacterium]
MKKIFLCLFLVAFIAPTELHAKAASPGKAIAKGVKSVGKAIGGKGNPITKLFSLVLKLPKEMAQYAKTMKDSAKSIKDIGKKLPKAKTPEELTAVFGEIKKLVSKLEGIENKFESNKLVAEVAKGVAVCDSPATKPLAMAPPTGGAVGYVCGMLKGTDAKFTGIGAFMRSLLNTAMQYEAKASAKILALTGTAPVDDDIVPEDPEGSAEDALAAGTTAVAGKAATAAAAGKTAPPATKPKKGKK